MFCVDFAEAKGGGIDAFSAAMGIRTEIVSAVIIANLFQGEQDWQGTLFGVGTRHYRCHSV